jgi:hypothetical protein
MPCHALGGNAFGHVGQMAADLFFTDPQRLGEVLSVHGRFLHDGDHLLSKCFHNGHLNDSVPISAEGL